MVALYSGVNLGNVEIGVFAPLAAFDNVRGTDKLQALSGRREIKLDLRH